MFQGTVPGFHPSKKSHAIALTVVAELHDPLAAACVTPPADVALVRTLSGLAAEQMANDPQGRLFAAQTEPRHPRRRGRDPFWEATAQARTRRLLCPPIAALPGAARGAACRAE
jgi:hypothetical protein